MVFPLDSLQDYQLIFKPEHEMLRKSIREFLEREVAPHALEFDDKDEVPRDVLRKLGEQVYGASALMRAWRAGWRYDIGRYINGGVE